MNILFNYGMIALPATLLVLQAGTQSSTSDPWQMIREIIMFIASILLAWAVKYVRESRAEVKSAKLSLPSSEDFTKLKADVALLTDALERTRHERDEAQNLAESATKALEKANKLLEEERAVNANWGKVSEENEKKIVELQQQVQLLNLVNERVERLAVQISDRIVQVLTSDGKIKGDGNAS